VSGNQPIAKQVEQCIKRLDFPSSISV